MDTQIDIQLGYSTSDSVKDKDTHEKLRTINKTRAIKACSLCNMPYNIFLVMDYKDYDFDNHNKQNIFFICNFCYRLRHLDQTLDGFEGSEKFKSQFDLCISDLSQYEIVFKTVKYIYENKTVPKPEDIDPGVQHTTTRINFDTYHSLSTDENIDMSMFKAFASKHFGTDFITANTQSLSKIFGDVEVETKKIKQTTQQLYQSL